MWVDKFGKVIAVGDVVTVNVKYRIEAINPDGSILAHKIYDVPAEAVTLFEKAK